MTLIRIATALMILASFTACDLLEGAGSDDLGVIPSPAGSPTSFQLSGKVSIRFTLSDIHTCEDLLLADLPRPETEEEVTATIRHQEAQSQMDLITERTVSIFDAGEGDPTAAPDEEAAGADGHLATVSTDDEITTAEVEDAEPAPGTIECAASTSFSTVLPPADEYTFVVRGVTGDPEPVAYEDLQANGFGCDIQIDAAGGLVEDAPCGIES